MKNPVHVEKKFNSLCHKLNTSASKRCQWNRIAEFLSDIKEELARFDTFVIQLIPYFPVIENPVSFSGIDPEGIVPILELLNFCEKQVPEIRQQERYIKSRDSLLKCVCLLFAFAGAFQRLVEVFELVTQKEVKPSIISEDNGYEQYDNLAQTSNLAAKVRAAGFDVLADLLDQILETWLIELNKEPHSVLIPVVDKNASNNTYKEGRLRRLEAQVTGEKNERGDSITNSFVVVGAEQAETPQNNIGKVVRSRLNKTHPELQDRFFDILLSYKLHQGWQVGYSSEPGAACISYSAILDYCGCRETFNINPNLAITGELNGDGSLSPVDSESIAAKAQAVFFSWVSVLAVPEGQQAEFNSEIVLLSEKYPCRGNIQVIAISHLNELFFDRRATNHEVKSRTKYYLGQAWKQKFNVGGIALIIILLLFIARLLYGPIDRNPVNGVFKGEYLFVENEFGQTLVRLDAGFRQERTAMENSSKGDNPEVQFVDINNDNVNEVIWATDTANNKGETESVNCWSVSGDSLVWQHPLQESITFPRKTGMIDKHYIIGSLSKETMPGGKTFIFVESTMRETFPGVIFQLDAATGQIVSKYVHTGMIGDIQLIDLAGDKVREIVFSGVNNAFSNAVLGVLDVRKFGGHSPLQGDYIMEDVRPAEHLYYLLIPKTIVGKYLDPISYYNVSYNINSGQDSLLNVLIRDGNAEPFEGVEQDPLIFAYFDYNLRPLGFTTSDRYDFISEKLYREGKIATMPDYDYFEAFKDSILYWDGQEFILSKNRR